MVIADVNATSRYWYHYEPTESPPPPTRLPPDTTITAGPSGTVTGHRRVVLVLLDRGGLDVRVPLGRCRVRGVHVAEGPTRGWRRISHVRGAGHRRGRQHRHQPGDHDLDDPPSTPPATDRAGIGQLDVEDDRLDHSGDTRPTGVASGDVLVSCVALNGGTVAATGCPQAGRRLAAPTTAATQGVRLLQGGHRVGADKLHLDDVVVHRRRRHRRYSGATGLDITCRHGLGCVGCLGHRGAGHDDQRPTPCLSAA